MEAEAVRDNLLHVAAASVKTWAGPTSTPRPP